MTHEHWLTILKALLTSKTIAEMATNSECPGCEACEDNAAIIKDVEAAMEAVSTASGIQVLKLTKAEADELEAELAEFQTTMH